MGKRAWCVALAGLAATSVMAQSTVSISGRLNASLERRDVNGTEAGGLYNNASRLRIVGTEDLGGGLKAGFWLEHGFEIDTGAQSGGAFWNRRTQVSLASASLGEVRLGNVQSESYFATADAVSLHNHDTGISADALYALVARKVEKLAYTSPDLAGVRLDLGVALGEAGPNLGRNYDAAARWKFGALDLGLGYEKSDTARQVALRAMYTAGAVTLGGYVQRDRDGKRIDAGSRTSVRLAAMLTLGSSELHLNVGRAGDYSRIDDSSATQYTVAYGYNLSRRTRLYAFYTKLDDQGTVYGDVSSIAVGMRQNF